ncbi:MAG: deoxyribonuclease IV [Clostridia bacterium]|nr:deoxyribonuclease IV [Clostridia bacterium]
MPRFGIHLSISDGFESTARRAVELGCDAVQMFSRSPRTLRSKPILEEDGLAFRDAVGAARLAPIVIHTNYLINVASPEDETYERSVAALAQELSRADILGAQYVVMHPGHHMGAGPAASGERVARAIDRAYLETSASVRLCLENMSGSGTEVGSSFTELAHIVELADARGSIDMCFDTCHAFGAGYDVTSTAGIDALLDELDRAVGIERLVVIHANDSKGALGSHRDRHEHIGEGFIGFAGFRNLIVHPSLHDLPFILETPVDSPADQERDLAAIRSCAEPHTDEEEQD